MDTFGDQLILTANYDLAPAQQISASLSRDAGKFRITNGEGYLNTLGIDRTTRPETESDPEDHLLGAMVLRGVPYGIKYQWVIQLQMLTPIEAQTIEDIVTNQRNGKLTKMSDRILPLSELAPRTRPISAAYANPSPSPGFVYYYADFLVWLAITERGVFDCETRELTLTATEYDKPLTP